MLIKISIYGCDVIEEKSFLSNAFKFLNSALLMVLSAGVIGILVILIIAAIVVLLAVAFSCFIMWAMCNACSDYSSVSPAAIAILTSILPF
ncbi:hypothetical protein [Methanocella arvoryzae]|uniref:hypothetical protein n=1 Tax=Methanocella arvoryzae TaxID=1175445 RepID=UPI0011D1FB05|nr:hypothetical protein [Methanocella arvoryzae]